MRIPIFFLFFMICNLVKSQTEIDFFNEFLLGGEAKKYTKNISTSKIARLCKITVNYQADKADTLNVEIVEFYKNGIQKNYTNYYKNEIMRSSFKYRGRRFISGSYYDWIIEEGDTMVNRSIQMFQYKKTKKLKFLQGEIIGTMNTKRLIQQFIIIKRKI